ncbi:formate dehydrogenase subunit gamma [Aquabacterium sp.]|uniref:formate dehydrogenase subunit gamma n=1 Tax=Aquabacterium sp. TaxID=1872578 RepID=UPI002C96D09A|nr:formate dehydrogenase subunit gamma [Aquabacterium sp.]HSW03123.1 formate dehydrogenase subunit gamma [Aquabacterium sp.]
MSALQGITIKAAGPAVNKLPSPELLATVRTVIAQHADEPGALLPILHGVQDALGHVPAEVVPEIAFALNLSRAEVHGVITYYHHFRSQPAAQHVLQICRAEACQAMGAEALLAHAKDQLGCGLHGTSRDGQVTLEAAYCLGLCASSPAIAIDDELHARVTPELFDELMAEACGAQRRAA